MRRVRAYLLQPPENESMCMHVTLQMSRNSRPPTETHLEFQRSGRPRACKTLFWASVVQSLVFATLAFSHLSSV